MVDSKEHDRKILGKAVFLLMEIVQDQGKVLAAFADVADAANVTEAQKSQFRAFFDLVEHSEEVGASILERLNELNKLADQLNEPAV